MSRTSRRPRLCARGRSSTSPRCVAGHRSRSPRVCRKSREITKCHLASSANRANTVWLNTKGYPSTYLAMGFAHVRAGTRYPSTRVPFCIATLNRGRPRVGSLRPTLDAAFLGHRRGGRGVCAVARTDSLDKVVDAIDRSSHAPATPFDGPLASPAAG